MGGGRERGGSLTAAERAELLRRIRDGETFEGAAAAVGCSSKSVQRLLARSGGVKCRARPRARLRLSLAEREEISRGLIAEDTQEGSCHGVRRFTRRRLSTASAAPLADG